MKVARSILYNRIPSFMADLNDVSGLRRATFKQHDTIGGWLLDKFGGHNNETKKLLNNDIAVVGVESVIHKTLDYEQDFYDIELEKNHFFVHSLGSITHNCCRLNINLKELQNRPGHIFAMGDNTGSVGVVTINVNRLSYEANGDKKEFFKKLEYYMKIAKDSLEIKRKVVDNNLKNGLMPYTKVYLGSFNNHFSTIGICGMNEACMNMFGARKDITSKEGKDFSIETLNFMRGLIKEFQQETENLYNLEATPAESTAFRLAKLDKKYYPNIITSGEKAPYLTNSTQLPVGYTDDLIEAIEHQNEIQPMYTGGTIFHIFLGEKMSGWKSCMNLVKSVSEKTKIPYFSITPTFSICPVHGYVKGEHFNCPSDIEESESVVESGGNGSETVSQEEPVSEPEKQVFENREDPAAIQAPVTDEQIKRE